MFTLLRSKELDKVLYIDIQTVGLPYSESGFDLLYNSKGGDVNIAVKESKLNYYKEHSCLYAEVSRVACIGLRYKSGKHFVNRYYEDKDEFSLLRLFFLDVSKLLNKGELGCKYSYICGHNILHFDLPFLLRRSLIKGLRLSLIPGCFHFYNRKPWENTNILDTFQYWKLGGHSPSLLSLEALCFALGILREPIAINYCDLYDCYYGDGNFFEDNGDRSCFRNIAENNLICLSDIMETLSKTMNE
jgi:hypothetical protein